MKNRKNQLTVVVFLVALALAPMVQAAPSPDGGPTRVTANLAPQPGPGPTRPPANEAPQPQGGPSIGSEAAVITIHSTDNVVRGKTGSFVLAMNPALMLGGMYVNFKVSGTAVAGADYVALVSPAYIGGSGYSVIQVQTLANPRGSLDRKAYSVIVTLEAGAGYAIGASSSATMWIKP